MPDARGPAEPGHRALGAAWHTLPDVRKPLSLGVALPLAGVAIGMSLTGARPFARQQATFRGGVDLVHLDVTVLDSNRHPVTGLTADDFTVLEDGEARPVLTFKAVTVPPASPPPAEWMREREPDVTTNARRGGRLVAIVIDDASFEPVEAEGAADVMDAFAIQNVRDTARTLVNDLGPDDLAALVYTGDALESEDFTKDRQRLLRSIDRAALLPSSKGNLNAMPTQDGGVVDRQEGGIRGSCYCGLCSMETIERLSDALGALPEERKTIMLISAGVAVEYGERGTGASGIPSPFAALLDSCKSRRGTAVDRMLRAAQRANVTIHAFDPRGPMTGGVAENSGRRTEYLRTAAEETGGRAIVNTNAPASSVQAVLDESGSYYMLGFESGVPQDDGAYHALKVRVDRPGVDVLARRGYYAPTPKEQKALDEKRAPAGTADAAIAGPLPDSDLPLAVTLLPFLGAGNKPEVAAVVGVTEPNDPALRVRARTQDVDLVAAIFGPTGSGQGTERHTMSVVVNPTPADYIYYETMARLPMTKGRHSVRVGVRAGEGRVGSVYSAIDVPDFSGAPLSLSGIFLSATPAARTAPPDVLRGAIPIVPTARRLFTTTDRVRCFVRIYQARSRAPRVTNVKATITDAADRVVAVTNRLYAPASFEKTHAVDLEMDLPIETLAPGTYQLAIAARADDADARGTIVFALRAEDERR